MLAGYTRRFTNAFAANFTEVKYDCPFRSGDIGRFYNRRVPAGFIVDR